MNLGICNTSIVPVQIEGDWNLIEYMASFDGKPFPPHSPFLCPESKIVFGPAGLGINISVGNKNSPTIIKIKNAIFWVLLLQAERKGGST